MNRIVRELIGMSRALAADPRRVVGGGGNASIKDRRTLYIKASGTAMSALTADDVVAVRIDAVMALLHRADWPADRERKEEAIAAAMLAARVRPVAGGPRPSVETMFHALMPWRCVLHVHPIDVNVLASSRGGRPRAEAVLAAPGVWGLWIDYCDPGLTLGQRIHEALAAADAVPNVMILANHGLLVGADSPAAVGRLVRKVGRGAAWAGGGGGLPTRRPTARQRDLARLIAPAIRGACDGPRTVLYDPRPALLELAAAADGKALATAGPISPDQIVYAGPAPAWVDLGGGGLPDSSAASPVVVERVRVALDRYRKRQRSDPRIVVVRGVGAFALHHTPVQARAARDVYWSVAETLIAMRRLGGPRVLTRRQTAFIDDWSAERYRRSLLEGRSGRRADRLVVLVTGAGQGVGEGLARGLADEGAFVVCADVRAETVTRVAEAIRAEHGPDAALAVQADCTSPEQMAAAVRAVVDAFGGLDVLISNAGILTAHKVTDFDAARWRRVVDVNLCGYFVSAQVAARVMCLERRGHIIQVNSKSGKKGSRYNSAYAASKFGGIGLTQSLALDLAEDGIRVNCICPGNFFDLPLWQAPGGLLDQYRAKHGGVSRQEVLKHYLAQVPLGRGATVDDVLKTVFYILEQSYETGQAYNVTGGQEMR